MSASFSSILTAMGEVRSIRIFSSSSPYLLNSLIVDIFFASCEFDVGSVTEADITEPVTPSAAVPTPSFIASRLEYLFFICSTGDAQINACKYAVKSLHFAMFKSTSMQNAPKSTDKS
jgi:hypothetical protein